VLQDDARFDRFIAGLRVGDEDVVGEFAAQYRPALERLAKGRIEPGLRRRVGAETIAQSVCRTFLRRAQEGQFELADGDALWRLLCAMALTKVREKIRFHRRLKRDVGRERPIDGGPSLAGAPSACDPAQAVAFAEQLERVVEDFSVEERRIFEMRLLDRTQCEIAEALLISERTVRRMLRALETRMRASLGVGGA